jgi:predicted Zn-dependent protease
MARTASDPTRAPMNNQRLKFEIGSKAHQVSPEDAIVLAHALIAAKKYDRAGQICEVLLGQDSLDSCAAIFLACCKAGLRDFAACSQLVKNVLGEENLQLAEHLHAALVFHELGPTPDAVSELTAATNDAPDMPILWLLLGDEYAVIGNRNKAALCWRLAIDRDTRGGLVALVAQRQMARLRGTKPTSPSKTNDILPNKGSS